LLDAFPAGTLSEIVGPPSSGASSLLTALLARATAAGGQVALVDGAGTFDPTSAAASGAELTRVLWIRCGGRIEPACRAADLLAHCPGFALLALDLAELSSPARRAVPRSLWLRLARAVEGSPTAVVLRAPERLTGSLAALVVSVRRVRSRWTGHPRPTRLGGVVSRIDVVRARVPGAEGGSVEWLP
jgi:hypothetical protein